MDGGPRSVCPRRGGIARGNAALAAHGHRDGAGPRNPGGAGRPGPSQDHGGVGTRDDVDTRPSYPGGVNVPAVPVPAAETEAIVPEPAAVTITGCLERDAETFRLKDTAGTDVPKSRSWKSGFLKKGSASIEVVDAANRLDLSNHVGRRVSVSGTRVDREMQARSLRRVAASC